MEQVARKMRDVPVAQLVAVIGVHAIGDEQPERAVDRKDRHRRQQHRGVKLSEVVEAQAEIPRACQMTSRAEVSYNEHVSLSLSLSLSFSLSLSLSLSCSLSYLHCTRTDGCHLAHRNSHYCCSL